MGFPISEIQTVKQPFGKKKKKSLQPHRHCVLPGHMDFSVFGGSVGRTFQRFPLWCAESECQNLRFRAC